MRELGTRNVNLTLSSWALWMVLKQKDKVIEFLHN